MTRIDLAPGPALILCHRTDDRPPYVSGTGPNFVWAPDAVRLRMEGHSAVDRHRDLAPLVWQLLRSGSRPREAVIHRFEEADPIAIVAAALLGVWRFHFVYGAGGTFSTTTGRALALTMVRATRRGLARVPGLKAFVRSVLRAEIEAPVTSLRRTHRAVRALVEHGEASEDRATRTPGGRPFRIDHVISALGAGGAERQLVQLVGASVRAGFGVRVLSLLPTPADGDPLARQIQDLGGTLVLLPTYPASKSLPRWADPNGAAAPILWDSLDHHAARGHLVPLVEALRADPPSVVHAWLDEPIGVAAAAGLALHIPRIILSVRNLSPAHFPRLLQPWFRGSLRLASHSSRMVLVANSRAGATDYAQWAGISASRFTVIPNGIDISTFEPLTPEQRNQERERLGIPAEAYLVAGVFRLAPEKRPLDFLEALARLRPRVPSLKAILVGSGPDEAAVRERASALGLDSCLTFQGTVANPERYLRLADVSVLTSLAEGCPNAALESQALEVPVVITNGGGSPEAVLDGETGFLCEVGDVDAFVRHLATFASQPGLALAFGRGGRRFVSQKFSLAAVSARTLDLYRPDP